MVTEVEKKFGPLMNEIRRTGRQPTPAEEYLFYRNTWEKGGLTDDEFIKKTRECLARPKIAGTESEELAAWTSIKDAGLLTGDQLRARRKALYPAPKKKMTATKMVLLAAGVLATFALFKSCSDAEAGKNEKNPSVNAVVQKQLTSVERVLQEKETWREGFAERIKGFDKNTQKAMMDGMWKVSILDEWMAQNARGMMYTQKNDKFNAAVCENYKADLNKAMTEADSRIPAHMRTGVENICASAIEEYQKTGKRPDLKKAMDSIITMETARQRQMNANSAQR